MVTQTFQRNKGTELFPDAEFELVPMDEGAGPTTLIHPHRMRWVQGTVVTLASLTLLVLTAMILPPSRHTGQQALFVDGAVSGTDIQGLVALSENNTSGANESSDEAKPFDCDAGYNNWEKGWSDGKKEWCCENANRGCSDIDWAFNPALVVHNFTQSSNESHEHCLSVTAGDMVFIHEKHSSEWTYVYTRWFINSTHGWVPHWALDDNTSKVVRSFNHNASSEHHKDCISVTKGESVFVRRSDSGWTWIKKIAVIDKEFQQIQGWVPNWALPQASKDDKAGETRGKDEDKKRDH